MKNSAKLLALSTVSYMWALAPFIALADYPNYGEDYKWIATSGGDLNTASNWEAMKDTVAEGVVPSPTNSVFFNPDTQGDVVFTASEDFEVNSFVFSKQSTVSNYIFNLGTKADPKTFYVNKSITFRDGVSTSTVSGNLFDAKSNFILQNGTIAVTNGDFGVFQNRNASNHPADGEGIKFIVDGSSSLLAVSNKFTFGNINHAKTRNLGCNSTILFQNGGRFVGGDFSSCSSTSNVMLRVTGEGSSITAKNINVGGSFATCLIESNAVINCSTKFVLGSGGGGCRLDITNATLNLNELNVGRASSNYNLFNDFHIWKGSQVSLNTLHVGAINGAHNARLFIHPEVTMELPSVNVATYNNDNVSNCLFSAEGAFVNCKGAFYVGNGNLSSTGHNGMSLTDGATLVVDDNITINGGLVVGDYCSIEDSSLIMTGSGKTFKLGTKSGKGGGRFPTNTTLTVSRGELLCTNSTVALVGYTPKIHLTDSHFVSSVLIIGRNNITGTAEIDSITTNGVFQLTGTNNVEVASALVVTNSSIVVFDVPVSGYNVAPVVVAGKTYIDESTKFEFNSKEFQKKGGGIIPLIASANGFEGLLYNEDGAKSYVTNISVALNGAGVIDSILYVANDNNDTPTLYGKLPSLSGFRVIIR